MDKNEILKKEEINKAVINAKLIRDYCIENGMRKKEANFFARLSIEFDDFEYWFERTDGDKHQLQLVLYHIIRRREANRINSTLL